MHIRLWQKFLRKTEQLLIPMKLLVFLFLHILLSDQCPHIHALCSSRDRDALLSFSINIYPPLNWSSSVSCCSWEGIGCDMNDQVTHLWLPSRNISGHIPPSLTNLTSLSHLNLSYNFLAGHLPDGFFLSLNNLEIIDLSYNSLTGKLTNNLPATIQTVDLSSNSFGGTIQASFLSSTFNLMSFNISNNTFGGTLPSSICKSSPFLFLLDLSFNAFSEKISEGLGECSNLEILRAGFNNLTGQLPSDIYSLGSLQEFFFPANRLSGQIGEGISNLTSLRILALFGNLLTGFIPQNIGRLSDLEVLVLHLNNLRGTLPPSLMNCTNLRTLNARDNSLVGQFSSFNFSMFIHLEAIDLGNNYFSGTLPTSLFFCKSLKAIRLSHNQLTGEISSDIRESKHLSFLSLSNNNLTNFSVAIRILISLESLKTVILSKNFYNERMSNNIGKEGFRNIRLLALGGCKLHGQIPTWLGSLQKLEVLDLSSNQITGSIPGWLGNLPNLFYLDLTENNLLGGFTKELTALPRLAMNGEVDVMDSSTDFHFPVLVQPYNTTLQYNKLTYFRRAIYLSNNSLSGNIPVEIRQLKFIHVLDLSNNNFSGIIPDTISSLINLEVLDLSGNHLSGVIPNSLKNLHYMSSFSVAYNNLRGPVPTGGQFDTFSDHSFEGNPGLCGPVLQRPCLSESASPTDPSTPKKGMHINDTIILALFIVMGFGGGLALTVTMLWLTKAGRWLMNRIVDDIVRKVFS